MVVLIDNGHGIDTAGKRSPDGRFREYLWNRQVAAMVVEFLTAEGIDARLVVPETDDVALSTRVRRVNKVCKEAGKPTSCWSLSTPTRRATAAAG